jgi:hypothetical protein
MLEKARWVSGYRKTAIRQSLVMMIGVGIFAIPVMGQNQTVGDPCADANSVTIESSPSMQSSLPPPTDPETDCVKSSAFFYSDWLKFGKPACWCYPRNCHGDADGRKQGNVPMGYTYVYTNDLGILISAWNIKEPPKGPGIGGAICADFDRKEQGNPIIGFGRVGPGDLNILIKYWQIKEPPKSPGVPDCMDTGHYNFFVNP